MTPYFHRILHLIFQSTENNTLQGLEAQLLHPVEIIKYNTGNLQCLRFPLCKSNPRAATVSSKGHFE